jgi:hypothetical protein
MSTDAYENRFRDPAHVAIWTRWQNARAMWRKAWWGIEWGQGGKDSIYNPDPSLIKDVAKQAEAQEYQEARTAYLIELKRYD